MCPKVKSDIKLLRQPEGVNFFVWCYIPDVIDSYNHIYCDDVEVSVKRVRRNGGCSYVYSISDQSSGSSSKYFIRSPEKKVRILFREA